MSKSQSESRPWGRFFILEEQEYFKCKRLVVSPGHQFSYQSHNQREEHWIFVKGEGKVILNESEVDVKAGSYIQIPRQAKHRIRNTGTVSLELVEVQLGDYFGEDDIVRYSDDYSRG